METPELFELLKAKAVNGKGVLALSKLTSRMDRGVRTRTTLNFEFEISNFWSDGFVFKYEGAHRILDLINSKYCETVIL